MKNIVIISLLSVFGFFTGCAPVTCEELDGHAKKVSLQKDSATNKYKMQEIKKADMYKTAGSKKMAKKSYSDVIEALGALKEGGKKKLKCKFSELTRTMSASGSFIDTYEEGKDEVDLSELTSDFESREKEAKEELAKLK